MRFTREDKMVRPMTPRVIRVGRVLGVQSKAELLAIVATSDCKVTQVKAGRCGGAGDLEYFSCKAKGSVSPRGLRHGGFGTTTVRGSKHRVWR